EIGGDGHHAAAVDAIDVADALRRHAVREVADWHVPHLGLYAQIVDLVEAAALGRKAHQDVHRFVAVDRPVFGRLEAIGDGLASAADGVDAGAVFRRLRLVDVELPVDAGKRLAVIEIADVAARGQDGRDLAGGRRQVGGIERAELHLDRFAGRRARARRRHFDQDARAVGGPGAGAVPGILRRRAGAAGPRPRPGGPRGLPCGVAAPPRLR